MADPERGLSRLGCFLPGDRDRVRPAPRNIHPMRLSKTVHDGECDSISFASSVFVHILTIISVSVLAVCFATRARDLRVLLVFDKCPFLLPKSGLVQPFVIEVNWFNCSGCCCKGSTSILGI